MRSILFLLLTLSVSISRAAVVCVPNPDGSWTCSGSGSLEDIPGLVVTNGLGVCTNCVAMTPEFCNMLRRDSLDALNFAYQHMSPIFNDLNDARVALTALREEGQALGQIASNSLSAGVNPRPDGYSIAQWFDQNFGSQILDYTISNTGVPATNKSSLYTFAGANSIVNYYSTAVAPALDNALSSVSSAFEATMGLTADLDAIGVVVRAIDCSECTLSDTEPGGSGGSGSGGSGGSGSGGSGGSCCAPCLEQMQALNSTVHNISSKVDNLDKNVDALLTRVNEFKYEVRQCFDRLQATVDQIKGFSSAISNNTFRIDSYLRTDLDNMARDIATNVLVIAQNVDGIQKDYYTAFKNAASFLDSNGNPGLTTSLVDVQTNFFSESEYRNLPWPMRVEMLLLSLAKPFSSSDDFPQPSDDAQKDIERAVGALDALDPSSHLQEYQTSTRTVLDSLTTTYSGLSSIFSNPSLPQSVRLLEADQWIGDQGLMINLDPNVCSPCRVIFSLIWSVIAMILLVKAWLLVFRICLPVFDLCSKFLHFIVKA